MSEYIITDEHKGHWLTGEEIVRCRNCTQRESDYCHWIDRFVELDGFCKWGERIER